MDSAILERYKREIAYLQTLLDANGIPYDYEEYHKGKSAKMTPPLNCSGGLLASGRGQRYKNLSKKQQGSWRSGLLNHSCGVVCG